MSIVLCLGFQLEFRQTQVQVFDLVDTVDVGGGVQWDVEGAVGVRAKMMS